MNILITGGAGFIGSHLCKRFLSEGHSVICLDNFITGSRMNIESILDNHNFRLIEHDISNSIIINEDLDWVLHFASLASPVHYMNYPIKTLKSGLNGTYTCLGIAKAKKAKFFLASTSEVYGDPLVHPQSEEYWGNVNPIGIRSCYDESKRGAEALTYAYLRKHGVDVRVIRIFNTYGPNMQLNDGRVVSNFIVQALKNIDLTVYGDGTQTRSFCYVEDLVEGIRLLMDTDYKQPLNLGNSGEYTMSDLGKMVIELTNSKSHMKFEPLPQDDPKRRRPNISKAKEILGWEPKIPVQDGIKKTAEWFATQIK